MFDAFDHGESIYNIIPPKEVVQAKPPMYKSKFSPTAPPTAATIGHGQSSHPIATNIGGDSTREAVTKKAGRTFGRQPGSDRKLPTNFTKKNPDLKVKTLSDVKNTQPELLQPSVLKPKMKPDVPKTSEAPVMNLVSSKNFVVANAVETILAAPKKVQTEAKDYLKKEDYGKTPKYLQHIKQDIQDEYDYILNMQREEEEYQKSLVRPMTEEERVSLIEGLKARWEKVNTDYQGTAHMTVLDTTGKMKRKEMWEAELSQLEKDIERLNKKGIIIDQRF